LIRCFGYLYLWLTPKIYLSIPKIQSEAKPYFFARKKGQKRVAQGFLLPFSVLLPESLSSIKNLPLWWRTLYTRSPELRPIVVHLPERFVPRVFLELAPSVACKLALSHNHLPLIYFYYFQNNSLGNLSQAFLKAETLFINKNYIF
jgi:hypothetical protein